MTAPRAVPLEARAPAPDVARGGMLLLIALANVHLYLYDRPLGVRLYPADVSGIDRVVTVLQLTLVDGRAYPLFGVLFGYGLGQLTARRLAEGMPAALVVSTVRRRGVALFLLGAIHAIVLWSGDIASAYGVLAAALAGVLVTGTRVSLATTVIVGALLASFVGAFSGFPSRGTAPVPSVAMDEPLAAMGFRFAEWSTGVLIGSVLSVVAAVALGAWAARHRVLDEPARHRPLLVRVAVVGIAAAVLGGLPLALSAAGPWRPDGATLLVAGLLHTLGGYAGGLGYAAVFALLVVRGPGPWLRAPLLRALGACGQRSLSCYVGQSVLFDAVLPAWTLGWGAQLGVASAAAVAVVVWLVLLLAAVAMARRGYRGPAELALRRLTYGPAAAPVSRPGDGPAPPAPR